jgi:hypothetical protein
MIFNYSKVGDNKIDFNFFFLAKNRSIIFHRKKERHLKMYRIDKEIIFFFYSSQKKKNSDSSVKITT